MVLGAVDGREHERVLDGHAGADREAHAVVDVAELADGVGLAVVAAERDPRGAVAQDRRDQLEQVLARRALPDEHPHALAALLLELVEAGALVVGLDPGREVRVQHAAAEAGRVTVDPARTCRGDLGPELGVAGDDGREVHDLGDADRTDVVEELLELGHADLGTRALERRGGNAARRADAEGEGQARRGFGQRGHPGHAEHVGDLVGVGRDRRRPVREDGAHELVDPELGRLEVHVAVDEARRQRGAPDVDGLDARRGGPTPRRRRRRSRGRCRPIPWCGARRRARRSGGGRRARRRGRRREHVALPGVGPCPHGTGARRASGQVLTRSGTPAPRWRGRSARPRRRCSP